MNRMFGDEEEVITGRHYRMTDLGEYSHLTLFSSDPSAPLLMILNIWSIRQLIHLVNY